MRSNSCPKCQGSMVEGFIPAESSGWPRVSHWIAGAPVKSMLTGLKLRGKPKLAIRTQRCNRCGFLENYAA